MWAFCDQSQLVSAISEVAEAVRENNRRGFSVVDYLMDPGIVGAIVTILGIGITVFVAYVHLKKQFTLQIVSEFYHGSNIKTRINKVLDYIVGGRNSDDSEFEREFNELSSLMPTIRHAVVDKFVNERIVRSYFESHFAAIVIAAEKLGVEGTRELRYSPRTAELLTRWGIIDSRSPQATKHAHELIEERFRARCHVDEDGTRHYTWYQRLR